MGETPLALSSHIDIEPFTSMLRVRPPSISTLMIWAVFFLCEVEFHRQDTSVPGTKPRGADSFS